MSKPAPTSVPPADHDLVARAARGEEQAIGTLCDRYGGALYAVAYRIVGQRADAEDVVIEAFAQAWRDARRFEATRGSVAGWLTMIARSRALDLVRAWDPKRSSAIINGFRLKPVPDGKAYQLWFIKDGKPVPSVTFRPEATGHVRVERVPVPTDGTLSAAAITVAPAGGSPQPTSPILLVGPLQKS